MHVDAQAEKAASYSDEIRKEVAASGTRTTHLLEDLTSTQRALAILQGIYEGNIFVSQNGLKANLEQMYEEIGRNHLAAAEKSDAPIQAKIREAINLAMRLGLTAEGNIPLANHPDTRQWTLRPGVTERSGQGRA